MPIIHEQYPFDRFGETAALRIGFAIGCDVVAVVVEKSFAPAIDYASFQPVGRKFGERGQRVPPKSCFCRKTCVVTGTALD